MLANRTLALLLLGCVLMGTNARAEEIQFPENELPSESVVPVLDYPQAVQSRLLSFSKRFELDASTGWLLDEPFYQNQYSSISAFYNWTEFSGLGLKYLIFFQGLSDYSKQFANSGANLHLDRAPGPQNAILLTYEYRLLYGKISFSKDVITPISIFSFVEGGTMKYGSRSLPLLGLGIGQKTFFNTHWGMQLLLEVQYRQALDPLSANIRGDAPTIAAEGDFGTKTELGTNLGLSLIYLF